MNGQIKFHKINSPAFRAGEVWEGSHGFKLEIVSVYKYPDTKSNRLSDYIVHYKWLSCNGKEHHREEDAWNFQVRYTHLADTYI